MLILATNKLPLTLFSGDKSGKVGSTISVHCNCFGPRARDTSSEITFERDRLNYPDFLIFRGGCERASSLTRFRAVGFSSEFACKIKSHRKGRIMAPRRSSAYRVSVGDYAGGPKPAEGTQSSSSGANEATGPHLIESIRGYEPPRFLWRTLYTLLLLGLVIKRVLWHRKLNMQQTLQQISRVGPDTLGVSMLTSSFVGMVFTIQFCKEFSKVGLTRVIGGLLGLAFTRELTPVICAIVLAGRVGSAVAAELGTMQVSEQVDQLRTLGSDPVDYLVAPRVVACAVSLPILSVISFTIGMAASILLADIRYGISPNAIVDSAAKYLESFDVGVMCAKGFAFGSVISIISCGWGQTTTGGAKGVGESTTASVVISLVAIFVVDFFLSMFFFKK